MNLFFWLDLRSDLTLHGSLLASNLQLNLSATLTLGDFVVAFQSSHEHPLFPESATDNNLNLASHYIAPEIVEYFGFFFFQQVRKLLQGEGHIGYAFHTTEVAQSAA